MPAFPPALAVVALLVLAGADPDPNFRPPSEETALDTGPVSVSVGGTVLAPTWVSGEATGFGLGLESIRVFHTDSARTNTASSLQMVAITDFDGRWRTGGRLDLHWGGNTWHGRLDAHYEGLRATMYGVGNPAPLPDPEFYAPDEVQVRSVLAHRLVRSLRAGLLYDVHRHAAGETEEGGLLAAGGPLAGQDGLVSGLGLVLALDSRDAVFAPSRGVYGQFLVTGYAGIVGSDFGFTEYELDVRAYTGVADAHVLAGQAYVQTVRGAVPVWRLPTVGERPHSRAYEAERLRDRTLAGLQAEWRWRWSERFGWEVFAGAAALGHDAATLRLADVLPSLGGGLRITREIDGQRVPFRVTGAWGRDGWTVVVGAGDAF